MTNRPVFNVKFNHLALQVKDIPATNNFYLNVLGLTPVTVPDDLKKIRAWFDIGNGQQLHFLAGRTFKVNNDRNGSHLCLFVDSIASAKKYLSETKISFHEQIRFDGVIQIYFEDPDGYLIEFQQKQPAKPTSKK